MEVSLAPGGAAPALEATASAPSAGRSAGACHRMCGPSYMKQCPDVLSMKPCAHQHRRQGRSQAALPARWRAALRQGGEGRQITWRICPPASILPCRLRQQAALQPHARRWTGRPPAGRAQRGERSGAMATEVRTEVAEGGGAARTAPAAASAVPVPAPSRAPHAAGPGVRRARLLKVRGWFCALVLQAAQLTGTLQTTDEQHA